jgi:hypothetical protein
MFGWLCCGVIVGGFGAFLLFFADGCWQRQRLRQWQRQWLRQRQWVRLVANANGKGYGNGYDGKKL